LVCSSLSPEICRVICHEYATTATRVTMSPRSNPVVGERAGAA